MLVSESQIEQPLIDGVGPYADFTQDRSNKFSFIFTLVLCRESCKAWVLKGGPTPLYMSSLCIFTNQRPLTLCASHQGVPFSE